MIIAGVAIVSIFGYMGIKKDMLEEQAIILVEEGELQNQDQNKSDMVGVGNEKCWIFQTLRKGKYTLEFTYKKSWEEDSTQDTKSVYTILVE
ncbi:protease inhibitor I42 family protein [Clostridium grantii]|nr:protease inhibitor I42 family protein [Clostridium grantii]